MKARSELRLRAALEQALETLDSAYNFTTDDDYSDMKAIREGIMSVCKRHGFERMGELVAGEDPGDEQ